MKPSTDKEYIAGHLLDDVRQLALKIRSESSDLNVPFILRQIAGRQSVIDKLPTWYANEDLIYPEHLPLEQCSSELTAKYKSSLCSGHSFTDLTGGFGVDCAYISNNFKQVVYVEKQETLCDLARHNFRALELNHFQVFHADSIEYLQQMEPVDCIYLDPARRDKTGKKTVSLSDCEPDVSVLKDLLLQKSNMLLVKLSPMLDISLALKFLPETVQVHVVSVDNECKELLFFLHRNFQGEPVIHCVNLSPKKKLQQIQFLRSEEEDTIPEYPSSPGLYLYEPNASVLKGGGYKIMTKRFPVQKLQVDSHLYTSNHSVADFPGRIFRIRQVFSLNKQSLQEHLKNLKQANITVRNFPASVDEIRKKTKLKPGGNVYLFATTLSGGAKVLIQCEKIES